MQEYQYIFCSICLLFYLLIIIYLSLRLRDVIKKPQKYEELALHKKAIALASAKQPSRFFRSLSHKYGIIYFIPIFILTMASSVFLMIGYFKILVGNRGYLIMNGASFSGLIALLFILITLIMVLIPLHIKKPAFGVIVLDSFNFKSEGRFGIWKKAYLMTLIFFIIGFPFITLSLNAFAYYNDTGVYSSSYFEIAGEFTNYEEISHVYIYIHHNNSDKVDTFHYDITLKNGKVLDINSSNIGGKFIREQTYQVHLLLEKKYIGDIEIEPLNDIDYKYIAKLNESSQKYLYYIYEGFHR